MTESVLKADEGEGMHEHRNPPPHLARAYKKQTTPPLSPSRPSPIRPVRGAGMAGNYPPLSANLKPPRRINPVTPNNTRFVTSFPDGRDIMGRHEGAVPERRLRYAA